MSRRSNLSNLIADTFLHGAAHASSYKWRAERVGETVQVWHHQTPMFDVDRYGEVYPVDRGHGSSSDRCGVRRITAGFGCETPMGVGYRELYDAETREWADRDRVWATEEVRRMPEGPGTRPSTRVGPGAPRSVSHFQFGSRSRDMNLRGPDYSKPDPFEDIGEAVRQGNQIDADLEESERWLEEYDQREGERRREWRAQ